MIHDRTEALLALHEFRMNASDGELEERGLTREQLDGFIREMDFRTCAVARQRRVDLVDVLLSAFVAGRAMK